MGAKAQTTIHGVVKDHLNDKILDSVFVKNIHSNDTTSVDTNGAFKLVVKSNELIEIKRNKYETLRVRIINEKQPSYYVLHLEKIKPLLDVKGNLLAYQLDSLEFDQIYGIIVNGERKGEVDMRSLPLAALSKQNREKWAFQEMYAKWQGEKYIDFVFNQELVKKITYLSGNDLRRFMRLYRPTAAFLRKATRYEYLNYIKKSYERFKIQERY